MGGGWGAWRNAGGDEGSRTSSRRAATHAARPDLHAAPSLPPPAHLGGQLPEGAVAQVKVHQAGVAAAPLLRGAVGAQFGQRG